MLLVKIISFEKNIFEGKALKILASSAKGEFSILNAHENFICGLEAGPIKITDEHNEEHTFNLLQASTNKVNKNYVGFLTVRNNMVNILVG